MSTEQTAAIIRDNKKIGTRITPDYDHSMGLSTDTSVAASLSSFASTTRAGCPRA